MARPRDAGAASLTSGSDDTNEYSNPVRNTVSPMTATTRESPAASTVAEPTSSTTSPAAAERRLPIRSENAAEPTLAVSSSAPNNAATNPRKLVDTP